MTANAARPTTVKLPVLRPVSWPTLALLMLLVIVCGALGYAVAPFDHPALNFLVGAYVYLIPVLLMKQLLLVRHVGVRRPIKAIRRGEFDRAIAEAERVYAYFRQHPTLERWRTVLFFEPSKVKYSEAALTQIASAQMYGGRKDAYLDTLRRYLIEYPDGLLSDAYRAALAMAAS